MGRKAAEKAVEILEKAVEEQRYNFFYLAITLNLILPGAVGVLGKPLLAAVLFLTFSRYGLNDISDRRLL